MIMQARTVPRRKTLRRNLKAMNADGFSFSVMVGIAETYLPAFVLSRGHGDLTAALIATLPVLMGSILQLAAPFALNRLGSHRRFVVTTASLQATSMLVLVVMALIPNVPAWAIFVPATLYWAAGLSTGPAWNTWVEQLVPQQIRSGFFARRSRMCHIGVLLGLVSGGLLLRWSVQHQLTETVFAVLFGIGATGRFVSAWMLARQTETGRPVSTTAETRDASLAGTTSVDPVSPRQRLINVLQAIRHPGSAGQLVLFLMAVQTAVHISGPYFNPFMLRVLQMSWVDYMGLLSLGFVGKMISLPWAGRFANRFGADRLLWVGSVGIVPVSALWFFSQDFWFLACLQIISGLVWGCYELAMLLQFFRQIPGERRVAVLTVYNLGNSAAMVAGTFIGAAILNSLGRTHDAFLTVFIVSGLARFVALLALPGRQHAVQSTRSTVRDIVNKGVVRTSVAHFSATNLGARLNALRSVGMTLPAIRPLPLTQPALKVPSGLHDNSQVFVSPESTEGSSVSSRFPDGGSSGTRRRDGLPTRLPARIDPSLSTDLHPSD
jgi:MFS family permease